MSNTAIQIKECPKIGCFNDMENNDIRKLLSFKDVKNVVQRILNSDVDLVKYSIQPYSDGKIGFLGSHYRLNVIATKKEETIAFSLFVKTIPFDTPEQAKYVIERGVFKQETQFYSVMMPLLCEGYHGESWAPICYEAKESLMIFEELGDKGYTMRNKLFDKTLVCAGLTAIAQFHAASLLTEARLQIPCNQLYPGALAEKGFINEGTSRKWFEEGINAAAIITKHLGHDPKLLRLACEQIYEAVKPSRTKTNTISHGDLWGNNFMFNNDVPPKCVLIDYQLLRYSPLAHDVAQFLYLCTDRSFREKWEVAMLQYYYKVLCEILHTHNSHMKKPSWSELIDGMEEQRLGAVIIATMYFPSVLMDENLSAQIMNDSASFVEYNFQNRGKFILSNMEKDEVYARRISETIIELVELASRLDELPKPS